MNLFKKKSNWNITLSPPVRIPNSRDERLPSIYNESDMIDFAKYVWYTKSIHDYKHGLTDYFNEWKENPYKWEKL